MCNYTTIFSFNFVQIGTQNEKTNRNTITYDVKVSIISTTNLF